MADTTQEKETVSVINSKIIDDDKNTQLHHYAAEGKLEKMSEDAIDRQKIDVENYLGWTPLMMASKNGHKEIIMFLLNLGADPSRKNRYGMSVFHISIFCGKLDIVQTLLEHLLCGGISKRSLQHLFSPISLAILFRNPEIFEYLITQKFDINAVTPYIGVTPLMFAAAMEDQEAFNSLKKHGADISIKNHNGFTAQGVKDKKTIIEERKKPPKPLTPAEMISQSPHMTPFQNFQVFLSPQQGFYNFGVGMPQMRSNVLTPSPNCYITTPRLTPVTPMSPFNMLPQAQVFFAPDFCSAHHLCAPNSSPCLNSYNNTPEFHNARMNQSNFVWSPSGLPTTNNLSPCM